MRTTNLFAHAALLCAFAFSPFGSSALASALVDINTADAALLDTLPGIGPSKAAAIVAYRNAHGPFAVIEDIQNVSGIKGDTYAGLASFITVGATGTATGASNSNASSTTSATQDTRASTGASTYVPPSPVLLVDAGADRQAVLEAAAASFGNRESERRRTGFLSADNMEFRRRVVRDGQFGR
jgi:competence protein ComEA helix-hairpin-helix repeat region